MMLIVPLPWASRPWALPFLTVSAPSTAVDTVQGRRYKTSVDRLRQMLLQVMRWLPGRWVLVRGASLKPCLLFRTGPTASPDQIIAWYAQHWNLEVTLEEVRAHLGFEPRRQSNALAIARSSLALPGQFSLVTWLAHQLLAHPGDLPIRFTAW